MSFSGWLVAIGVVLLILAITIGLGWWFRNRQYNNTTAAATASIENNPLTNITSWSTLQPSSNPTKNICQVYTFPTAEINDTVIPGSPTLNSATLTTTAGFTGTFTCIDSDQIAARQVTHTCIAPEGVLPGQASACRLQNGGLTGLGGSETFFTACPGSGTPACAGQMSLVSVNFQAPANPNIYCIQNNGPQSTVTMVPCDPTQTDQLYRITRVNAGQNPQTLQPGQGQNGPIAQILQRETGLCLAAGNVPVTTTYDPSYLSSFGCTGPTQQISGTNVVLTTCDVGTGGTYPGYNWYLLPSFNVCLDPNGCTGCVASQGCSNCARPPQSTICTGCSVGCTGGENMQTPPQIVWTGNIDMSAIPTGSYQGLTGNSAIFLWMQDQGAQSLYWGGTGSTLVLAQLGSDYAYCPDRPYVSQYINLSLYNIMSQQEACLQTSTSTSDLCGVF